MSFRVGVEPRRAPGQFLLPFGQFTFWESPGTGFRVAVQIDEWYQEIAASHFVLLAMTRVLVAALRNDHLHLLLCP